ncbi:MAG: hypothetical protein RLZZ244_2688 [Verrucomicrobiota bacterium]
MGCPPALPSPVAMAPQRVTNKVPEFVLLLTKLHQLLSASRPHVPLTTKMLAAKLQAGEKMVCKAIAFLRDSLHYDVEYLASEHRWHYHWRPFRGSRRALSDLLPNAPHAEEISAVFLAQKALVHLQDSAVGATLQELRQLLSGNDTSTFSLVETKMEERFSIQDGGVSRVRPEVFETLQRCVLHQLEVGFEYTKRGHFRSDPRIVRPYHLTRTDSVWYLIAFDCERRDLRIFSLSRMEKLHVTHRQFERPADFSAAEFLKHTFGVFRTEGEPQKIRVRFDAWAATSIREKQWHHSQQETPLEDGGIEITLTLSSFFEVERWILSWGRHATVLEPASLVERIREHARLTLLQHPAP